MRHCTVHVGFDALIAADVDVVDSERFDHDMAVGICLVSPWVSRPADTLCSLFISGRGLISAAYTTSYKKDDAQLTPRQDGDLVRTPSTSATARTLCQ